MSNPTISMLALHHVQAVVIVMGSNHNPDFFIKKGIACLRNFMKNKGKLHLLTHHTSADHSKQSPYLYHNQGILLQFDEPMDIALLQEHLRAIELLCQRNRHLEKITRLVNMDLDILQVWVDDCCYDIKERLPFKQHEVFCMVN